MLTVDARLGRELLGLAAVNPDEPFPKETVRDLIGIARALYMAFQRMGPSYSTQLNTLTAIGIKLGRALEKGSMGGPGTWNHKTAWLMADAAAKELGELVDLYLPAKHLITATGEKLAGKKR